MTEAVWDAAYRELGAHASRLYRLLAGHPGSHLTPEGAAAVLGEGAEAAEDAVDELESTGLLQLRLDGRLHFHDLLRAHARRRARQDGDAAEAAAALRRTVRWYRRQAARADALVSGERMRLATPVAPLPYAPDAPLADAAAARRWLEAERQALFGCVRLAGEHGAEDDAWSLCEPLWTYYLDHPHHAEPVAEAFRLGLAAAGRAGRPAAQVRMRCQLAQPLWELGRFEEAHRVLDPASSAAEALHDPAVLACAIGFRGVLHAAEGDWSGAAEDFEQARQLYQGAGDDEGVLAQTHLLGTVLARSACTGKTDPRGAARLLEQAHTMALDRDDERMIGLTAHELAGVYRTQGRTECATELYARALSSARRRGCEPDEARVREALAELAEAAGEHEAAQNHRRLVRALGVRRGTLPGSR